MKKDLNFALLIRADREEKTLRDFVDSIIGIYIEGEELLRRLKINEELAGMELRYQGNDLREQINDLLNNTGPREITIETWEKDKDAPRKIYKIFKK